MSNKNKEALLGCLFAIVFFVGGVALSALITLWLWNTLAGYFGFKQITYFISLLIVIALTVVGSVFKK